MLIDGVGVESRGVTKHYEPEKGTSISFIFKLLLKKIGLIRAKVEATFCLCLMELPCP